MTNAAGESPISQDVPNGHTRDAGFTLPELLIAVIISGILLVSISVAFTTILQSQASATSRLAESKDITFVQTWIPVDLSSAIASFDSPDDAEVAAGLAGPKLKTPIVINADLPGTNVLTVVRPDLETNPVTYYVVAYRYEQVNGEWQISRYEIRNPGKANEVVKVVGVAHEVPAPPAGWVEGQAVDFAAKVTARTQYVRPVGEDVTVEFESGKEFKSGGGGLSAENQLPENNEGGLRDPSAPPSRCGKRIALVLDTSGSVPAGNGGINLEDAAVGFINGFTGTPTTFSINGFDREAYSMLTPGSPGAPAGNGTRAPFVSVLNPGAAVDAMKTRISSLDNRDGNWDQNNADFTPVATGQPASPLTGDGIHWDQVGSGTNWQDGLWNVLRMSDGTPYGLDQPEMVVFVTDGQPNRVRTAAGGNTEVSETDAKNAAVVQAEFARDVGARVIGVLVGSAAGNSTYVGYLKEVTKGVPWDGSVSGSTINIGNAAGAGVFAGSFAELGNILRSIAIAECGGTLTVQKRIIEGPDLVTPDSGAWTYTTSIGADTLDRSKVASLTFDYVFQPGETSKDAYIIESGTSGVFDHAECTAGGLPVTSTPFTVDPRDGVTPAAGVTVTVAADQAVSCLMISRPS